MQTSIANLLFAILVLLSITFLQVTTSQDATTSNTSTNVTSTSAEAAPIELSNSSRLTELCPQLSDPTAYPENQRWQRVITEAKNGILLRTSDFRTDFSSVDFAPLVQSLKAQGVTLVVAQLPPRALVFQDYFLEQTAPEDYVASKAAKSYNKFLQEVRTAGALAPNLFEDILRTNMQASYYLARDNHWDYHGVKLTAQSIATLLEDFEFTTQAYATNESYKLNIQGEHTKTVKLICDLYLPYMKSIEAITDVVSESAEEASNQSTSLSLFADETIDVVLVGTSFSHEVRNFHGYLQEALSTDVLVYQLQGQGIYTGIIEYLSSSSFQEHKPKVLIWEIPANFPVTAQRGMDQIIAAANSSHCQSSDRVTTNLLEANQNQFSLLNEALNIPQDETFSLVRFDLPKPPRAATISLKYESGEAVPFRISRSHLSDVKHQVYLPVIQEQGDLIEIEVTTQTQLTQDFSSDLYLCQSTFLQ